MDNKGFWLLRAGLLLISVMITLWSVREALLWSEIEESQRFEWLGVSLLKQKPAINNELEALAKPLEYMVWGNERRAAEARHLRGLQDAIINQPFNATHWSNYYWAQSRRVVPNRREQAFSFFLTKELAAWDTRTHIPLAFYCVRHIDSAIPLERQACASVMEQMPFTEESLAKRLHIDLSTLRHAFKQAQPVATTNNP